MTMAYKDLLVHLADDQGCAGRIAAAVRLAARHGAHLAGLYPIVEIPLLHYIRARIPHEIQARMEAEAQAQADAALQAFAAAAGAAGVSYETRMDRALDTTLASVVAMHARYADLLVVGQADPDAPPEVGRDLPQQVVLASGRPLLLVPHDWRPGALGERVLLAWDASREAARAASAALPILEQAASVLVLSIDPESTPLGHGELPGADIGTHLARHGIAAEVHAIEGDQMQVGDALLSFAADRACDLLVMGAYAHPRLRELVLGGATRTILGSTTLPVLMAH
jgi:nucleotide-binding universal stress UspA family protein